MTMGTVFYQQNYLPKNLALCHRVRRYSKQCEPTMSSLFSTCMYLAYKTQIQKSKILHHIFFLINEQQVSVGYVYI